MSLCLAHFIRLGQEVNSLPCLASGEIYDFGRFDNAFIYEFFMGNLIYF